MTVLATTPLDDPAGLSAPAGASVWWLGQAGFLVAIGGLRIVIDAYLSDSLAEKYRGTRFPHKRMMPPPIAPDRLTGIDWILCTHGHTDHMDPGTIPPLIAANPSARVLAPRAERARAIDRGVPEDRLVLIDAGETVDLSGDLGRVLATATPSAHETLARTDAGYPCLGYALTGGGVTLWHSGDCVPYDGLQDWIVPLGVDLALLPVNGRDSERAGNGVPGNFTLFEAVALTEAVGARAMLGHHFGLFDFNTLDPAEGRRILSSLNHRADIRLCETATAYHVAPVDKPALSVLVVCKGNICRSPTADALLRQALPGHVVDSAAIMDWNVGKPPHPVSMAVAARRGVSLEGLVARQIDTADFSAFDLILGVDDETVGALVALRPADAPARTGHLGAFLEPGGDMTIADPWGRDDAAFEETFARIALACDRLASIIKAGRAGPATGDTRE